MTATLDQIAAAREAHDRAAADERMALDEMYRLIRMAAHDGRPIVHIAEAAGVSRQTVYNVIGRGGS